MNHFTETNRSQSTTITPLQLKLRCVFVLYLFVSLQQQVHVSSGHQTLLRNSKLLHQILSNLKLNKYLNKGRQKCVFSKDSVRLWAASVGR